MKDRNILILILLDTILLFYCIFILGWKSEFYTYNI